MDAYIHTIAIWTMLIISIIILYYLFFYEEKHTENIIQTRDTFEMNTNHNNGKWNVNLLGMNDDQMKYVINRLSLSNTNILSNNI